jgi:3-oxoadipate enol-lactonase
VELNFTDSGGPGAAVVLVHAIGCDLRMWEPLEAALAPRLRVIRVDARGHGASPVSAQPCTLEDLADDVSGVLDRAGTARVHWVGLSMGGMIGQAFALRHPARLERLVIANSTSSYGADGRAMWEARARAVKAGGLAAIKDMVMERYFSVQFRARHPEAVATIAERFLQTPAEGYIACCAAIAGLDFTGRLGAIRAPALVIAGSEDIGTPVAMSAEIARAIPGARLAVIRGAAHLSAVEDPVAFNTLVDDFLSAPGDPEGA